jgi:hypothetical protein
MPRKVFFSFHYENDIWRVNQIRNSQVVAAKYGTPQFIDKASWESVRKKKRNEIMDWIDRQMLGTSVIVVLIGCDTHDREYVQYEIEQAYYRKMGMLGIYINNVKNQERETSYLGECPFKYVQVSYRNKLVPLLDVISYDIQSYGWSKDGYDNIGEWIEEAARAAGR